MKKSELRKIIKEEIHRALNETLGPDPDSSDVERIMGNFKDEEYLPAMNPKDRKILIAVLERYIDFS